MLISENFWQRRFAGDPSILGKSVKLNGVAFTIIGITPRDFVGTLINVPNLWLPVRLWPLASKTSNILRDREENSCEMYGRAAPGVSLQQAQAEMTLLAGRAAASPCAPFGRQPDNRHPSDAWISHRAGARTPRLGTGICSSIDSRRGGPGLADCLRQRWQPAVGPLRRAAERNGNTVVHWRKPLPHCSATAHRKRSAGPDRGGASLLMTWGALRLLMVAIAASLPLEWGSLALHVEPDLRVFAYVFALSLFASVLFGLAPALQSSRPSLSSALKEEGSGFALRISNSRLRDLLMAAQAAACLFLLIAAGLLIRGSIRSMTVSPGYETKQVLSIDVMFPRGLGYNHAKQLAETNQLLARIGRVPGVKSVAIGLAPDGGGLRTAAVGLNGSKPSTDKTARTVFYSFVTPDFFECLSMPLIEGTLFRHSLPRRNRL